MKHPLKRTFTQFVTDRPYQIMIGSATALVVAASTTGALLTRPEDGERPAAAAAVAELSRPAGTDAEAPDRSRHEPETTSPTATPPAKSTAKPGAKPAPVAATATSPAPTTPAPAPTPAAKTVDYDYQAQINGWYCGPGATRIALTALDIHRKQDDLAARLGTTMSGTNSAHDVTRVLNALAGEKVYDSRFIPGNAATPAQMDRLQADVVRAVGAGRAVVANIAGSATDVNGAVYSYPGGHYVTVVGYRDSGRMVRIADPANPNASSYWMTTIALAHWIATRGYSH